MVTPIPGEKRFPDSASISGANADVGSYNGLVALTLDYKDGSGRVHAQFKSREDIDSLIEGLMEARDRSF